MKDVTMWRKKRMFPKEYTVSFFQKKVKKMTDVKSLLL